MGRWAWWVIRALAVGFGLGVAAVSLDLLPAGSNNLVAAVTVAVLLVVSVLAGRRAQRTPRTVWTGLPNLLMNALAVAGVVLPVVLVLAA